MRFCYDLDRALTGRGFAVSVCTSDQIDGRRRAHQLHEECDGIEIHRFRNPSNYLAGRAQWAAYFPLGLQRALVEYGRRADVIHLAEARGPHVRWTFRAARAAGVPIVWSPFGGLAEGVGIRRPYRRLYDLVHRTRRHVARAAVLMAQSRHEAALLERFGARPEQVRILGLGIDARRFSDLPPRGGFRGAIGIDPARPLVLFIGRFHPAKGLDVLLKAAALVRRTHADVAVVLVGWDHGALGTITRLSRSLGLERHVIVVPPLFGEAAVQAYVDADVFAMPVRLQEDTSLAAMEALAAGTPCVLTRECEVPNLEAIGGGRVTACTPGSFAAGLVSVLCDPQRRERAQSARSAILRSSTTEHVADAYAALFREVASRRGSADARPSAAAASIAS